MFNDIAKNKPTAFRSLVDILEYRSNFQPDDIAYIYHDFRKKEKIVITYSELRRKSISLSDYLLANDLSGKNILLFFRPGLDFIISYFACLYSKSIAVPISTPGRDDGSVKHIENICTDSHPKAIILNEDLLERFCKLKKDSTILKKLKTIDINIAIDKFIRFECSIKKINASISEIKENTLAFIQYTSGSTSLPKGVMVSHGNLVSNQKMIKEAFQHDETAVVVGWLPTFHDMGLIGNVLQPLFIGRPSIIFDPLAFIQKPLRWLQLISEYQATTSGGPNFGYELCIDRIKDSDKKDLNLSSWSLAFNGAEPVRKTTIDRFSDAFKVCGFNKNAFFPCYGLAESTLFVSGIPKKEEPTFLEVDGNLLSKNQVKVLTDNNIQDGDLELEKAAYTTTLTSCGAAVLDQKIKIVDPETLQELEENQVGEVWLKSDSNALGYWDNVDKTKAIFKAKYSSDNTEYLRTGDLGFINDGNLYISGRLKELIIISGKNHYPSDIEETAVLANEYARTTCAFSIEKNGEEKLIVLQEIQQKELSTEFEKTMANNIKADITKNHGIKTHDVVFIKPRRLSRTSSGKLQRNKEKQRYLASKCEDIKTLITPSPEFSNTIENTLS